MDQALVMIRRIIRVVLTLLLLGIVLNDGLRVSSTVSRASDGLTASMNAALTAVRAKPKDVVGGKAAAQTAADSQKISLDVYDQLVSESAASSHVTVTLAVSAPLERTIVAAPVLGMINGVPGSKWYEPGAVRIRLRSTKKVDDIGGAS